MKTILNTLMLTTMAVAGFAADNKLNFHVEFPFTIGKVVMPAGQYSIAENKSAQYGLQLTNKSTGTSAFLNLPSSNPARATEAKAEIVFGCAEGGCSIARVANLRAGQIYAAWMSKSILAKMIAVSLTPAETKAD